MPVKGQKMPKMVVKMADNSIFGHFSTLYRNLGITKTYLYCRRGSSIVIMPGTVGCTLLPLDVIHILLLH